MPRHILFCWLFILQSSRFFRIRGRYQFFIRNPFLEFTCFFQNIFQKLKAVPVENGIIFPGVLRFVAFNNVGDCRAVCFRKLRLDCLGDFIRTVGVDVS